MYNISVGHISFVWIRIFYNSVILEAASFITRDYFPVKAGLHEYVCFVLFCFCFVVFWLLLVYVM